MFIQPLKLGSGGSETSGEGTVTSVGLSAPASILAVDGSPITSSGTLDLTLIAQAVNKVFAGPTAGADAIPTFRSLVGADLPAADTYLIAGSNITIIGNTISAAGGGGGVSDFLSLTDTPSTYASQASKFVAVNGTPNALEFRNIVTADITGLSQNVLLGRRAVGGGAADQITIGSGLNMSGTTLSATGGSSGDVIGPVNSADNEMALFSGTSGKFIKRGTILSPDTNRLGPNGGGSTLELGLGGVNRLKLYGSTGSSPVILQAIGSGPNVGLDFVAQNTGSHNFLTGNTGSGSSGAKQVEISHVASAVNYLELKGNTAGNPARISALGADTNIDINLIPKGTGQLLVNGSPVGGGGSALGKNLIINGDFRIWQRGTNFPAIVSGGFPADRWTYVRVGDAVHTASKSTDVPTVAQAGRLFLNSLLFDCTTADTSIAAGDTTFFQQRIEGYDFQQIAQRPFTLSFWVKGTKTGIHCVAFRNVGADRNYIAEYTINVTNTWEKKTITVPASPSAGTWNYESGIGIQLIWALSAGTTWHGAANAWQTGNLFTTSNQVNATDNAANDFRITGVQLEAGEEATEFDFRHYEQELALCQRYYTNYNAGLGGGGSIFRSPIIGDFFSWVPLPTAMRVIPTMSVGIPSYSSAGGAAIFNPTSLGFELFLTASAVGGFAFIPWTASAEF